ncbi:MAG: T9SS type A sorting domain-containing protein, partial [FCB group bacterium]|nr:T9SS type A sorting domain-containing protein [FCB group bacterium]
IVGDQLCFTPDEGTDATYWFKVQVCDSCGTPSPPGSTSPPNSCVIDSFSVTVTFNQPPVASCPANETVSELCGPTEVCVGPFSATDADNPIVSETVDFSTLSSGQVCFTADTAGIYAITYTVTDSCGAVDECQTLVTVEFTNRPPIATCPGEQTLFVCDLTDITVPGFSCFDPDDNLISCEVDNGTLVGNEVTFTPVVGNNFITLTATDNCGETHFCQTKIVVSLNQTPVCDLPEGGTYFVCGDTTFSFPVSATDPDGNLNGCAKISGNGTFDGSNWTFTTSGPGTYSATFECSDNCGLTCSGTVNIIVNYNRAPEASCPGTVAIYKAVLEEICVAGFECIDLDNNLASCSVEGVSGTTTGTEVCFTPSGWGDHTVILIAVDECGEADTCNSVVTVIPLLQSPIVKIEKTHGTLQGHFEDVSITTEDSRLQMGGFEFLIAYDATALAAVEVLPGQLLEDCGWEHFTYRFGADGNCGSGCPSGLLRIIALAEINDGPNHPSCYGPPDEDPHELAKLRFLVTNDRTFQCMYAPIQFYWADCNDNAFSNVNGDSLYLGQRVYDFEGNLIWDEDDDDQFPEDARIPHVGAPDFCMSGDKTAPIRLIEFWNGGVDIICADSIDDAGDINLNGVANEVADAVMLTNYFVEGLHAFKDHVEGSIAASDVNVDGTSLSVADLVYLVRVIIGDANAYAKPIPTGSFNLVSRSGNSEATIDYDVSTPMGAVLLVFELEGQLSGSPELGEGAADMEMIYSTVDGQLRLLIYDIGMGQIIPGENRLVTIPINGTLTLIDVDAADYYGSVMNVSTRNLPGRFALMQNYPNPFNPTTTFNLSLPIETDWKVAVYNIAGQLVREFSGHDEPGTVSVRWDGNDLNGNRVASGIYLYKATADRFIATKKMVMMK